QVAFDDFTFSAQTIDSHGDIFIVGVGEHRDSIVMKLDASGQFDESFGDSGRVTVAAASFSPRAITVASDDQLIIAGTVAGSHGSARVRVYRLNSAGSLDSSFGDGGA